VSKGKAGGSILAFSRLCQISLRSFYRQNRQDSKRSNCTNRRRGLEARRL